MKDFLESLGVVHRTIAPTNSRGNALVERCILKLQNSSRVHQPTDADIPVFLASTLYALNFGLRPDSKYSPAQIFFSRTTPSLAQLPILSKTKKSTLSPSVRRLHDEAIEIRENVMSRMKEKRENIKEQPKYKLKIGDLVRIKMLVLRNQTKKLFRPYSFKKWRIIKVNRHTQTCLLQEVVSDPRSQPARLIRAFRFLKRIKSATKKELEKESNDWFNVVEPESNNPKTSEELPISERDVVPKENEVLKKEVPIESGSNDLTNWSSPGKDLVEINRGQYHDGDKGPRLTDNKEDSVVTSTDVIDSQRPVMKENDKSQHDKKDQTPHDVTNRDDANVIKEINDKEKRPTHSYFLRPRKKK